MLIGHHIKRIKIRESGNYYFNSSPLVKEHTMKTKLIILLTLISNILIGQDLLEGKVNNQEYGISFFIPEGWFGIGEEGIYMMTDTNKQSHIIIIMDKDYTFSEMQEELEEGVYLDDDNIYLPKSSLESFGRSKIGTQFYHSSRHTEAYIVGEVGPKGEGIIIISQVINEAYNSSKYQKIGLNLLESVEYDNVTTQPNIMADQNVQNITVSSNLQVKIIIPKKDASIEDWTNFFKNKKMKADGSNGPFNYVYEYYLCENGSYFWRNETNSAIVLKNEFGNPIAARYSDTSNNWSKGKWSVVLDENHRANLKFISSEGKHKDFKDVIERGNSEILLFGDLWYFSSIEDCE